MPVTSINNSGTLYVTGSLDEVSLGTGSVRFNGTSQYLTATVPTPPGTGSLTHECWFYTLATSTGQIMINTRSGDTSDGIDIGISGANRIECTYSGSVLGTATSTIVRDTWYHVAVVRNGASAFTIYLNGVAESTFSNSTNFTSVNLSIGFTTTTTKYFNGYISNVRILNGSAVYTGNFRPPTAPLTPVFNTSFLLNNNSIRDSGIYNRTITNINSAISTAFNPFYIDYSLGSLNFNGSNQYLTVPSNAAFSFGTGDFTFEAWIYLNTAATGVSYRIFTNWSGGAESYQFYLRTNNRLVWQISTQNSPDVAALAITPFTWTHVAFCRSGTTINTFINGVLADTTTGVTNSANGAGTPRVGSDAAGGNYWLGYISNLTMVKGVALYTAAFTNPSRPLINVRGTQTSILLNTSAISASESLKDSSLNNFTVTPVNSPVSSTFNPFINYDARTVPNTVHRLVNTNNIQSGLQTLGEIDEVTMVQGSIFFNGTSAVLTSAAATAVTFGTSNFTVEFWVYIPVYSTGDANEKDIIEGNPSGGSFQIYIAGSGQGLRWGAFGVGGNTILAGASIPVGRWFHVAVSRAGTGASQTFAFINGSLTLTVTDNTTYSGIGLGIGGRNTGANYFAGYISNLRCVNGTALYTSNFTPSSVPLEQVPNTRLLLTTPYTGRYITDFSTSSVVLTNTGGVRSTGLSPFANIGSLVFNGINQHLIIPYNSKFDIPASTPVCFEAWVYTTSSNTFVMANRNWPFGSSGPTWAFYLSSGVTPAWGIAGTGSATFVMATSTLSGTLGQWNHYAFTRDASNVVRIFVNGQVGVTRTDSQAMTNASGSIYIGVSSNLASSYANGYMSNVRFVVGTAVYIAAFTPPTAPLIDSFGTQTSILLNTPASLDAFKDFSSNNFTATIVNTTSSTIFNPFLSNLSNPPTRDNTVQRVNNLGLQVSGSFDEFSLNRGSVSFNGSTQYLTAAYNLSLAQWWDTDYTIEMWILNNTNAQSATNGLPLQIGYGVPTTAATYWSFGTNAAGNLFFYYYNGAGVFTAVSSSTVPLNSWNHVTMVYRNSNTTLTGYINGVQAFSVAKSGTPQAPSGDTINIGSIQNTKYNGYISNLRIVRGVAVYTAAFSPPTQPLTLGVYNTQTSLLLNTVAFPALNRTDSSRNNFTVTAVGSPTPSELNPFNT